MNKTKQALGRCLVTGGAGFVGRNIARELLQQGNEVISFDVVKNDPGIDGLIEIIGDISDVDSINQACSGVETVFHTAAIICLLGGSAVTKEYRDRAFRINVLGTQNVIEACKRNGVKRLIQTSSNNVVFNGESLPDMDQRTPYATKIYDLYTETKLIAEQEVLAANGVGELLTCAIRPAGIYGPEKTVMMDETILSIAKGELHVLIGSANAIQDNTFIDNLVHAQLLVAQALEKGHPACGKAYFITDDEPRNNFEFFRYFIERMGYSFPTRRIPYQPVRMIMVIWEWLHFKFGFPEPPAAPKEVEKVGVTQWSNIKDARRDFGYEPLVSLEEAVERCIPYLKELTRDV